MHKMLLEVPARFESERLILRCYQPGDGPMYYAAGQKNRAHLERYEAGNAILTARSEEEAEILVRELAAEWAARRSFFLGAFDKATGAFVAQVYVGAVNWDTPEFEIGYFVDQDHQGRGFVTEAVGATLGFVFEHLQAHRVRLECDDTNVRSWRVAERCGFTREGHLRQNKRHPDGTWSGTYEYGLLRSEYESSVAATGIVPMHVSLSTASGATHGNLWLLWQVHRTKGIQRAAANALPPVVGRAFRGEADFWQVRNLLIETYPLTPPAFNWEIRRWDGWFFHRQEPSFDSPQTRTIRLWETKDGQLVGIAHPEGEGDVHLELHPDYRHIQEDMIAWAEEHLAARTLPTVVATSVASFQSDQGRHLDLYVLEYDAPRRRLLQERGYEKLPESGMTRRMRLGNRTANLPENELTNLPENELEGSDGPLPQAAIAEGYILRTTRPGDEGDYQRMADLLNAAFGRTFHAAAEYRNFVTRSPSFRHDLNLVAEAPDGSFAAHVGLTYERTNRYGVFEPVCTHPDHRRQGLARSLMFEGLHRLKALGATDVYVDTGDAIPANALYESVGFTEAYQGYTWRKTF